MGTVIVNLLINHSLLSCLSGSCVPQSILTLMLSDVPDLSQKGEDTVALGWYKTNPNMPEQPS